MAGGIVEVNGVEARLFKDTDPPIYILPDGRFVMRYGGLWKIRGSIKPLLALLGRFQAAISMVRPSRIYEPSVCSRDNIRPIEVVSMERGMIGLKDGKRMKNRYDTWYIHEPKKVEAINAIYAELHKLEVAHAKAVRDLARRQLSILKSMKVATEGNFRNIIAGIDCIRPRAKVNRGEA